MLSKHRVSKSRGCGNERCYCIGETTSLLGWEGHEVAMRDEAKEASRGGVGKALNAKLRAAKGAPASDPSFLPSGTWSTASSHGPGGAACPACFLLSGTRAKRAGPQPPT